MFINNKKLKKMFISFMAAGTSLFFVMLAVARKKKGNSVYADAPEQKNPMEGKKVFFVRNENDKENADGVKGHLEDVSESEHEPKFYEKYVKRIIDLVLSFGGLVLLSPIFAGIALAIVIDDPGPVLFTQKRIGKNKQYFKLHKFRSMKMSTPHDVPTHMLEDPEQYITRVGKFLRKHSLDELPQIWDIFVGNMSVIGPRPALWNQDVLVAERDKYGANDVKPGLTGWAQINGRDELEIEEKAKLDGEYVKKIGLLMDVECFLGTIGSVLASDGVVEGGTGEMSRKLVQPEEVADADKLREEILTGAVVLAGACTVSTGILTGLLHMCKGDCKKENPLTMGKNNGRKGVQGLKIMLAGAVAELLATVWVNIKRRVRLSDEFASEKEKEIIEPKENGKEEGLCHKVLITGAGSYIGTAVESWLMKHPEQYQVDTLDMMDETWREKDFSGYDVVYHVAGIAHADVGAVTEEQKKMYYKVNTDLAVEMAEKAKAEGVKQFIFMSSMIVYSGCREKMIHEDTKPEPLNFYGDSKWQADKKIHALVDETFKVVILRPPMIYGKGSKGNYPELAKLASKLPVFPIVKNKRSMLHIDNLCQFVKLMIDEEESGVFFPQNGEYTNTSDMVQMIADVKGHRIIMVPGTDLAVRLMKKIPGKIGQLAEKAFGDSAYDMSMSRYKKDYRVNSLRKSIQLTEGTRDE